MADSDKTERISANQEKFSHFDASGRLRFYHILTYDANGRLVRKAAFDPYGAPMGDECEYVYDSFGNILEGCWFFYGSGYLLKAEYKYDENHRMIESYAHGSAALNVVGHRNWVHRLEDGRIDYTVGYSVWREDDSHEDPVVSRYLYNDKKQNVKILYFRDEKDTEPFSVRTYEYDEAGRRVKDTSEEPVGHILYTDVTRYDADGNKIDITRYDADGKLQSVRQ